MSKRFDPFEQKRKSPRSPKSFTPEVAAELWRRIRSGRSVIDICNDEDMPTRSIVYEALHASPELADQYARAKEASAHAGHDQADQIATLAAQGRIDPNAARVAIDGIKWSNAHKNPKVYGKVLRLGGEGEGGAIPVRFEAISDGQLTQFIERLERAAGALGVERGEGREGAPPEAEDL